MWLSQSNVTGDTLLDTSRDQHTSHRSLAVVFIPLTGLYLGYPTDMQQSMLVDQINWLIIK